MTSNLMISALRQGNNGAEILNILDAITSGDISGYSALFTEGFERVESPVILGDGNHRVSTLQEIAF